MIYEDFVSIKELSKIINLHKSNLRKYILKLGIQPHKRRVKESGNQLALAVTKEEADIIIQSRRESGFNNPEKIIDSETGVFYIIQLVPDLDTKRIKFGFASNLNDRLDQHRTAAPTAVVLTTWPCKKCWEPTIIDFLSSVHCKLIRSEVFECDDLISLVQYGDKLFSLAPKPKI